MAAMHEACLQMCVDAAVHGWVAAAAVSTWPDPFFFIAAGCALQARWSQSQAGAWAVCNVWGWSRADACL